MIMKKILLYSSLLLAAVACTEKVTPEDNPSEGKLVPITISVGNEQIAKAQLDFPSVKWETTDHVAIFDGTGKRDFSVSSCEGSSATLSGSISDTATELLAVYPYSAAVNTSEGFLSVSVPSEQTLPENACADPAALVAVASAARGATLQFKNVIGLLKVSVDRDDVTEIVLVAGNGEAISGKAVVNPSTGAVKEISEAGSRISLKPAGTVFAQGDYYIPVLPGKLASGFKISAVTSDGASGMRTTTSENTVQRNGALANIILGDFNWSTTILDYAQLKAWAAKGNASGTLGADIAIGSDWTPVALNGATLFGNGHKLSGFVKDAVSQGEYGLFSKVENCTFEDIELTGFNITSTDQFLGGLAGSATNSTFTNCSFDGKLQCTAKVSWTGRSSVTGDANNFGVTGGIVGLSDGCTFEGCTYSGVLASLGKGTGGICGFAKATHIKDCTTVIGCEVYCCYHCAGLITGAVIGDSVIEGCSAEGFVGCLGWFTGGIAGWFENGLIENCVVGSHSYVSSTQYDVGGIVGHMQTISGGKASVDRCTVYANVQGQYDVGGIVGYTCQKTSGTLTVTNCAYLDGDLYATGINTYVAEYRTAVISGEEDLEATWEDYLAELDSLGYGEVRAVIQELPTFDDFIAGNY